MSRIRERLSRAWEQVPAYSNGRLDLGGLGVVVMTRKALQQSSEQHLTIGARIQQGDPEFLARLEKRQNPAPVRHLRAI